MHEDGKTKPNKNNLFFLISSLFWKAVLTLRKAGIHEEIMTWLGMLLSEHQRHLLMYLIHNPDAMMLLCIGGLE